MKTKSRFKNTPLLNQMNMIKLTCVVCALILITGCRAWPIHNTDSLESGGKVIFVGAKQRGVITNVVKSEDGMNSVLRICSEPPPDVFSAIAASLAANASPAKGGAVSVGLSASLSENAATIERTQTINILRESMYRTCERYMSGAISKNEFIVQAARDQRAMVAVLAIEQLTGVQKAASTALTTASSAVSGLSGDAITTLHKAREDYTNLQAQANAKKKEAVDSKPMGDCNGLNEDIAEEDKKKKLMLCEEAKDLQQKADEAKAHYDILQKAMTQATVLATNSKGMLSSTGQINQMSAPKHIADKVVEIVENVGNFDEIEMSCVVLFRSLSKEKLGEKTTVEQQELPEVRLLQNCLKLIEAKTKMKIAAEEEKVAMSGERMESIQKRRKNTKINDLWNKVNPNGKGDTKFFDELIKKVVPSVHPRYLKLIRQAIASNKKADFAIQINLALHPDNLARLLEPE